MANKRAEVNTTLTVCGFSTALQQNFITQAEGLDSRQAFTSIEYADFTSILKNASCLAPPFSLGVLKQKRLAGSKFWIEDVIRMNEIPHTATAFTPQILLEYIALYAAYVKTKVEPVGFVNVLQLDPDTWVDFETETFECLSSIQGHNGVPLSYLLRDDNCRSVLTVASDCDTKTF